MQKKLAHIHFWCTVGGVILFVQATYLALVYFTVGANSLYVSLCYGGLLSPDPLEKFCACWFITFPIAYITLYILALKKKWYIPFGVIISLDAAFCCISAFFELGRANTYGFKFLLPDVIISSVYCLLYFLSGYYDKKQQMKNTYEETALQTENGHII